MAVVYMFVFLWDHLQKPFMSHRRSQSYFKEASGENFQRGNPVTASLGYTASPQKDRAPCPGGHLIRAIGKF